MALSIGEIVATLRLQDNLTPALRVAAHHVAQAGRSMQELGASLKRVGEEMRSTGSAMTQAITLPLAAAGAAAFKFGTDFDTAMTKVETLSAISRERVDAMRKQVVALGPAVGIGPTPLAEALLVVTSTGLRGAEAMEILEAAAKGSAIGLGETKDVARAVTAAMVAYGKENLNAAAATDQLFAAVVEGGAEANEFAGSLGRVIGIASQVGVSFAEVVASVATFTRVGVDADEATTALRGTLSILLHPSQQARDELEALGTSIEELRRNVQDDGLTDALIGLVKATHGNLDAIGTVIPNVRALAGIMANAGSQAGDYRKVLDEVRDSTGKMGAAFARVQETLGFKWNQFLAEAQTLATTVGDKMLPAFTKLITVGRELLTVVAGLLDKFTALPDWMQKAAIGTLALGAALGPVLFALGNLTAAVGGIVGLLGRLGTMALPGAAAGLALLSPAGLAAAAALAGIGVVGYAAYSTLSRLEAQGESTGKRLQALGGDTQMTSTSLAGLNDLLPASIREGKELAKAADDAGAGIRKMSDEVIALRKALGADADKEMRDLVEAWRSLPEPLRATQAAMDAVAAEYGNLRKFASAISPELENIWVTSTQRIDEMSERTQAFRQVGVEAAQAVGKAMEGMSRGFGQVPIMGPLPSTAIGGMIGALAPMAKPLKDSFGKVFAAAFDDLPSLLVASLTGGGGVGGALNAVGVQFGQSLFAGKGPLSAVTKAVSGWMGPIGASLAAALPGLGAMIGPALSAVWGGLKKVFGVGPSKDELEARAVWGEFEKQFGSMDKTIQAVSEKYAEYGLTGAEAEADLRRALDATRVSAEAEAAALDVIKQKLETGRKIQEQATSAFDLMVSAVRDNSGVLSESLRPMLDRLLEMRGLTDEQRQALMDLAAGGSIDFQALTSKAAEYGITLDALGPTFQQADITDQASEILTDFENLKAAGADVGGVLAGMSDEVSELVQQALKYGAALPEGMRPIIENLAQAGVLTDENGNKITDLSAITFQATPLQESTDAIVAAIDRLGELLEQLPAAAREAAAGIPDNPFANWRPPPFMTPDVPVQEMAHGGMGRVTKPTLFMAGEAGPEDYAFSGGGRSFASGGSFGGSSSNVHDDEIHQEMVGMRRDIRALQAGLADAFVTAMAKGKSGRR